MYKSFKPGQTWHDKNGKRIQAHGGSVFYDRNDETYYFYGENKEYTKAGSNVWTWGVRAYASKDLYNWEDKGLIIEQDLLKKHQLEKDVINKVNDISRDTSVSDYVWLPLRFVDLCEKYPDGMIFVDWKDEWRIEDYE